MSLFDQDHSKRFPALCMRAAIPTVMVAGESTQQASLRSILGRCRKPLRVLDFKEYIPPFEQEKTKGILNVDWFDKHDQNYPWIVVSVFRANLVQKFEMWDDIQDKLLGDIQAVKTSLESRPIQFHFVVMHSGDSIESSESKRLAEGRITILRRQLGISSQNAHLLYLENNQSMGIEKLLESVETSIKGYVTSAISHYKSDKRISKNSVVGIRNYLKSGVLLEMVEDCINAFDMYYESYKQLLKFLPTMNGSTVTFSEVLTVADFLHYKIALLFFQAGKKRDAISLFDSHIKNFSTRIVPTNLNYLQYSWLQCQYKTFIDLLEANRLTDEVGKIRVGLIMGNYCYTMVMFMRKRLECEVTVKEEAPVIAPPQCWGETLGDDEYGKLELAQRPSLSESYLSEIENAKTHLQSPKLASASFYLDYMKAQELISKKRFSDVVALLTPMYEFFQDRDSFICSKVLEGLLQCAESLGNQDEIRRLTILLLNPRLPIDPSRRETLFRALPANAQLKPAFLIPSFSFSAVTASCGQDLSGDLVIQNTLPCPLHVEEGHLILSDATRIHIPSISLAPSGKTTHSLTYSAPKIPVTVSAKEIYLKIEGLQSDAEALALADSSSEHLTVILPKGDLQFEIQCERVHYVSEYTPLKYSITSQNVAYEGATIELSCGSKFTHQSGWYSQSPDGKFKLLSNSASFVLPKTDLPVGTTISDTLFLFFEREATLSIQMKILYKNTTLEMRQINILSMRPFSVNTTYSNEEFLSQPVTVSSSHFTASIDSPLLIHVRIENQAGAPLSVTGISYASDLMDYIILDTYGRITHPIDLLKSEVIHYLTRVQPNETKDEWKSSILITWKRAGSKDAHRIAYSLDPVTVYRAPFSLHFDFPPKPVFNQPFIFATTITNNYQEDQDIEFRFKPCSAFSVSRTPETVITVPADQSETIQLQLTPLDPGEYKLGELTVTSLKFNEQLVLNETIPSLFVMP